MADLLSKGESWLTRRRHAAMTQQVVYVRGSTEIPLLATIGQKRVGEEAQEAIVTQAESRDFIVRAQDLAVAGTRFVPTNGDRVREIGQDGVTYVYEVLSTPTEACWAWADGLRTSIRVRTKLASKQ